MVLDTTQEKFKKGVFIPKTDLSKAQQSATAFRFVFEENSGNEITRLSQRHRLRKMFFVHTKTQSQDFLNSSDWKSVLEKLCFRDGLVRTVGKTVEI